MTSKPTRVSSSLIGCPIHSALCHIEAKSFVNYYMLDCDILVSVFELKSCRHVHFQTHDLWKGEIPYCSCCGLNSNPFVFLQGRGSYFITLKSKFSIKQRNQATPFGLHGCLHFSLVCLILVPLPWLLLLFQHSDSCTFWLSSVIINNLLEFQWEYFFSSRRQIFFPAFMLRRYHIQMF